MIVKQKKSGKPDVVITFTHDEIMDLFRIAGQSSHTNIKNCLESSIEDEYIDSVVETLGNLYGELDTLGYAYNDAGDDES